MQSTLDEGSTFTIYLPRAINVEKYQTLVDNAKGASLVTNGTILVVEDDAAVRKILARSLLSYGFQVLEAEDGELGYELAVQYAAQLDLVITDVVMPKLGRC